MTKQFTTVSTRKNVQNYYNEKCKYNLNKYTMQFAIYIFTKNMELFKLYSKEKAIFLLN